MFKSAFSVQRVTCLILLCLCFLAGCIDMSPTPIPIAVVDTITPTNILKSTATTTRLPLTDATIATSVSSGTLQGTRIPTVTTTQQPTLIASPTIMPTHTVTPTPLPDVVWGQNIQPIALLDSKDVVWSPIENRIVLDKCSSRPTAQYNYIEKTEPFIKPVVDIAYEPLFQPLNVETPAIHCPANPKIIWEPDGKRFGFSGVPDDVSYLPTYGDGAFVHLINKNGADFRNSGLSLDFDNFYGWMGNNRVVSSNYSGGGHAVVRIDDVDKMENLAWGWSYAVGVPYVTSNYAVISFSLPDLNHEIGLFSPLQLEAIDEEKGRAQTPYTKFFATKDENEKIEFGSLLQNVFEQSEQLLILTWNNSQLLYADGVNILNDDSIFDLRVWDLKTDQRKILEPNAIYGRVSPDEQILLFLQPSPVHPELKLKHMSSEEIFFTQPIYVEVIHDFAEPLTTFSPDGRFVTFFDLNQSLVIFDLENQQEKQPVASAFVQPIWSPTSQHLIFFDDNQNLMLFDLVKNSIQPIVDSEDSMRLSNPQWSYDGSYLSVAIDYGGPNWRTAILRPR